MKYFNASDPRHVRMNPLRARRDKPHIWFEDGYWRVSPLPIKRRQVTRMSSTLWARARNAVHVANYRIDYP